MDHLLYQLQTVNVVAITHTDVTTTNSVNYSNTTKNATTITNIKNTNNTLARSVVDDDDNDLATMSRFALLRRCLIHANPGLEVIDTPFGALEPSVVIHTRKHQSRPLSQQQQQQQQQQPSYEHNSSITSISSKTPTSSTTPNSSTSPGPGAVAYPIVFRAHKPFHPSRLDLLLRRLTITDSLIEGNPADSNTHPLATHTNLSPAIDHPDGTVLDERVCDRFVRIKGVMWLAPYADNQVIVIPLALTGLSPSVHYITPTLPYITPYADNQTTPSSQYYASNNAIPTPLHSTHLTSFCVPSIHIHIPSVTCRLLENTLVKITIVPTHLYEGTIVCWVDHGGLVFRKTYGRKG